MHQVDSRYRTSKWYGGSGEIVPHPADGAFSVRAQFTIESDVRVMHGVFEPHNAFLADYYREYGRCVMVVDQTVDELYGEGIRGYFDAHGLPHRSLVVRAWEVDKHQPLVDRIMHFFAEQRVSRHEPVLIVGGGVLADVGGLAAALSHRRTPYVMIGTTIISAIDAGPSPRTCVNGHRFKNRLGAFHMPVLTIADHSFFRTLHPAHLRHGMAEILKMAFIDDHALYTLLAAHGERLVETRFGTLVDDPALTAVADTVLYRALRSYLGHEGTNPWEVHQARPHAFGHTWSPGYELPAGLLHGHAVSSGMALGATMAAEMGWIDGGERDAIIELCSRLGLAVHHPVLGDFDLMLDAQAMMIEKRGGTLWAPLPKGAIGACDYAERVEPSLLKATLATQKRLTAGLPREGLGIQMHRSDLGMG